MICPVCGNSTPDSLGECQFCSTPLTPVKILPQVTQQPYAQQPQYGMPQQTMPQQAAMMPQQTVQQGMQTQFGTPAAQMYNSAQPQYAMPQQQFSQPQQPNTAVQPTVPTVTAAADTAAVAPEDDFNEEEHEKKVSGGTLTALLVWFAVVGLLLALVHFNVPGMISDFLDSKFASDSDAAAEESIETDTSATEEDIPVTDQFYGTWVLCTYNIQDLSDGTVTGGQHYTHEKPLQFYTFDNGRLHRSLGSTAGMLEHTDMDYTYSNGIFSGAVLEGGSQNPEVAVSGDSMCIYDNLTINGKACYVEYALLRAFVEPAADDAVSVYASAIESGSVALPQYTSTVMTNVNTLTTTTPAPTSAAGATYNMIGTWLLISRENVKYDTAGQPISNNFSTIENGGLDYNYAVFDMDGDYNYFTIELSDDLSECISDDKKSGSFKFIDGLLDFPPSGKGISVNQSDDMMYFTYIIDKDDYSENVREEYKLISTEEYSRKQLMELRPEL